MAEAAAVGLRSAQVARDGVLAAGPEAVAYLQGQLSQDVAAIEAGASAWSWLLQPAGKVDALVRVTRTGPDTLLVDVDAGYGEAVLNRLARFKLRTKVTFEPVGVTALLLRGPGALLEAEEVAAEARAGGPTPVDGPTSVGGDDWPDGVAAAVVADALWPVPPTGAGDEAADVLLIGDPPVAVRADDIGATAWEAERIAAGVPAMGAELTERTIPAETGLVDRTASFTKGCYTGQELVARIDSRGGNVARRLRGLCSGAPLAVGTELKAEGKVVGTVTSAAVSAALGPIGLAYVGRAVAPDATVVAGEGDEVVVMALPIRKTQKT